MFLVFKEPLVNIPEYMSSETGPVQCIIARFPTHELVLPFRGGD